MYVEIGIQEKETVSFISFLIVLYKSFVNDLKVKLHEVLLIQFYLSYSYKIDLH